MLSQLFLELLEWIHCGPSITKSSNYLNSKLWAWIGAGVHHPLKCLPSHFSPQCGPFGGIPRQHSHDCCVYNLQLRLPEHYGACCHQPTCHWGGLALFHIFQKKNAFRLVYSFMLPVRAALQLCNCCTATFPTVSTQDWTEFVSAFYFSS